MVLNDEPVPPRRLNASIPRDLETISLKCLEKEPARRYSSAGALADDLRRYRNGEPILARPVTAWERAVKSARRKPVIAGLVALVVVVTAAGFAGITAMWREASTQSDLAQRRADDLSKAVGEKSKALEQVQSERARAERSLRDSQTALYTARLTEARRASTRWTMWKPTGFWPCAAPRTKAGTIAIWQRRGIGPGSASLVAHWWRSIPTAHAWRWPATTKR